MNWVEKCCLVEVEVEAWRTQKFKMSKLQNLIGNAILKKKSQVNIGLMGVQCILAELIEPDWT